MASPQSTSRLVAVGHERGVVAVEGEGQAVEQAQLALGLQAGRGADGGGEMSEVGHDASASVLQRVSAVNVGLSSFADAVRAQGAEVVDVDWRPPGGGEPGVVALLERAWGAHGERVEAANAAALRAIEGARPHAVTVAPAGEVIDGLEDRTLLHAGPPIDWERVCDPQRRALVAACLLEGWAADRSRGARAAGRRRGAPALRQRARPRRADDRRLLALDGRLGRAGRGIGDARVLDPQRGAGAHAVVRRGRRRGDRAGALPARPRRAAAGAPAGAHRADRRPRPRRPGAADGRRAAHAQPGGDQPALAPAAAGLRRRGRGGRRRRARGQPPLLPEPGHGRGEVRVAGGRGHARVDARDADGAQRLRHGAAGRRAAGPVVHRGGRAGPGRAPA